MMAQSKAYLTAIARKKLSAPTNYLSQNGLLRGRLLDYGCGRGDDATKLGMEKYDPHYSPELPQGKFDTITCNFVLNVIPDKLEREAVLDRISSLLNDGGVAYISVRNDRSQLKGWTSRGTWQGFIVLDLPVVSMKSSYIMYALRR